MKSYKILILTAALVISNASACIPECWAEKLGFPCCKEYNVEPEFTDEYGSWRIEDGQKCGIIYVDPNIDCIPSYPQPQKPEYKECTTCGSIVSIDENGTIWSEQNFPREKCIINLDNPVCKDQIKNTNWSYLLGYETCKEKQNIIYKDDEGMWGIENGQWCGIQNCPNCNNVESIDRYGNIWSTDEINGNKCIIDYTNNGSISCFNELYANCRSALNRYMCCRNTDKVVFRDNFGSWGLENEQWCGFNEKYPCSWYKEKGYQCCTDIYTESELLEKLKPNYVSEQEHASEDGIYVEINGEVCGLPENLFIKNLILNLNNLI